MKMTNRDIKEAERLARERGGSVIRIKTGKPKKKLRRSYRVTGTKFIWTRKKEAR